VKAAVCYEFGKPLVVEEVEIDPPQKGEVKVRLAATAICHSDIHFIRGELGRRLPVVLGHECSGYVDELGDGVTSVRPGDPVVVSLVAWCGRCPQCVLGRPHMCQFNWPLNSESRLHNKRGESLGNVLRMSGFAEYAIVDQSQLTPVPSEMPMDSAALVACGVITGVGSVMNLAKVPAMSSVAVLGVGGVGLNSVQAAAISGAYPVIAVDLLDHKLEAARGFGATHTVNAGDPEGVNKVRELTSGRGADYVFVTVGSSAAISQGFMMTAPRGMMVMVGLPPASEQVTLPTAIIWAERMVTMSVMGSTRPSIDIPKLIALYQAGRLKLDELITKRYQLEQINEAIESVEKGEALRNVIVF